MFCQKGVDDLVQHYLAKAGIFAARRLKESDMEKIAKATGAVIVGKIDKITKATWAWPMWSSRRRSARTT